VRRSTWCERSARQSYQRKGWLRHSPIGLISPSVSPNQNVSKSGSCASLSKRLWGSAPPFMQDSQIGKSLRHCARVRAPRVSCQFRVCGAVEAPADGFKQLLG
jgi:hypothetical protein